MHEVEPGPGEPLGQRQPDPARAAGDDRDLSLGELHRIPLDHVGRARVARPTDRSGVVLAVPGRVRRPSGDELAGAAPGRSSRSPPGAGVQAHDRAHPHQLHPTVVRDRPTRCRAGRRRRAATLSAMRATRPSSRRRDRPRSPPDRTSRTRPAWSSSAIHWQSMAVGSAATTSGRARQPPPASSANSTPRHVARHVRLHEDRRGRVVRRAGRRSPRACASASWTTVAASMAPVAAPERRRSGPAADGRTTSGRAPSWEMMRQTWTAVARVVGRPVGREHDAGRDRESGGTGGGEVGGLATHPRRVERGWGVQRDDGGGGVHASHEAWRPMSRTWS